MALRVKGIAELLNISPATVSLVLNNKPGVSDKTRKLVLKVVEDMGYDTNVLSKPALKNNKSIRFIVYKKHGNVVSDTPFFLTLMEGIDQESRKAGYNVVITYINESDNKMEVMRILEENPLQGILLLATEMEKDDVKPFMALGVPVVILDSYFKMEKYDSVVISNKEGAYEATQFLLENDHKEIGYLHSAVWINNFEERMEGFNQALIDSGIKPNKKYVFALCSTIEGAYQDMCKHLQSGIKLPTAFFADNDIIALGAIKALKDNGIHIPKDISIIGFDDMPFCEIIEPPLDTVKVYKQKMGMIATKRLFEKIQGNHEEFIKIEVGTELIKRKSVIKKH